MGEYTLLTLAGILIILLIEFLWLRTGLFRQAQYWIALGIVFFFQCLVDGWLTKLSNPIVLYNPDHHLGVRFPWDIPIEDFGFGFAMLTLTMVIWVRLKHGRGERSGRAGVRGDGAP